MSAVAGALAFGARVVCDPEQASRILLEARIVEARVPERHPELVAGLARRAGPDTPLAAVLANACHTGDDLSVQRGVSFAQPGSAAYEIVVTRASGRGCSLHQQRITLSVAVDADTVAYRLLDRPPPDVTPGPGCDAVPEWRETSTIDARGPVRLRLVRNRRGRRATVVDSRLEVWWANSNGWFRQTLAEPAPARHLSRHGAGPRFQLGRTSAGEPLVVASLDRTAPPCRALSGQTVWTRDEDRWTAIHGRAALTRLAREGLWTLAGDPGWLLILAQDEETDEPVLGPRMRRLQRRVPQPLYLFRSADFPDLNPGYLAIAPGPWPRRDLAEAFRALRPRRGAYVKQAWSPLDACAVDAVAGD